MGGEIVRDCAERETVVFNTDVDGIAVGEGERESEG